MKHLTIQYICGPGVLLIFLAPLSAQEKTKVEPTRVPNHGIQPQVQTDAQGDVHLLYFQGEHGNGDLYYVRTRNQDGKFSAPIKVNDIPLSAIATGNMRGGYLALGKKGRVHVVWNGSFKAKLSDPPNTTGMFYTRLNDAGDTFEPQRNIIQEAFGLDGGGGLAADATGNVFVTWHAPPPGMKGEANRTVWIARSIDDGKTFARETRASFRSDRLVRLLRHAYVPGQQGQSADVVPVGRRNREPRRPFAEREVRRHKVSKRQTAQASIGQLPDEHVFLCRDRRGRAGRLGQ